MIKINVTKPIAIPTGLKTPRTMDLKVGVHEVDDSILEHWFVKSAIAKGVVSIVKSVKRAYRTTEQINEANAKKILGSASITELKPTLKETKSIDDLVKAVADEDEPKEPVATEIKPVISQKEKKATTKIRKRI